MSDFKTLIEAVERGAIEDVRAIIESQPGLIHARDEIGATPLHYATLGGHRAVAELLIQQGAEVNATDAKFGATPAGWAIEYLREMGAFLGIELSDFAHAIRHRDVAWVARFLERFPALRYANDTQGRPFKLLADQSGNPEIVSMFQSDGAF